MVLRNINRVWRGVRIRLAKLFDNVRDYSAIFGQRGTNKVGEVAFPDHCHRGLASPKWLVGESTVTVATEAFLPDNRTAKDRTDAGREVSINWEDDTSAVDFSLERCGAPFRHGLARLPRTNIDALRRQGELMRLFYYERQKLDNNRYHGNIVFCQSCLKAQEKMVAAALALASSHLPSRR